MTYQEFIKAKVDIAKQTGFDISPDEINPTLMPHQRDAVVWALKGGRRALFESFGLGKTVQELEFVHQVVKHKGGHGLIVLPLGVKQEFTRGAEWHGRRGMERLGMACRGELWQGMLGRGSEWLS